MKKNLFEMGTNFNDEWTSDNKEKALNNKTIDIKEPSKHQLYFSKEKRRGKIVTILKPFYIEKKALQELLKMLKKKLGTGGTVKENSLEFQGEVEEKLFKELKLLEYKFKTKS